MIRNKRVLITGATGFIGANLTHRLVSQGNEVHLIIKTGSNKWRLQDIWHDIIEHQFDLADGESIEKLFADLKPELIYHLAAYAAYPFQKDVLQTIHTNLLGTVNLVNVAVKYGFESFINTGSSSEYGQKASPMRETDILEPNSLYAVTKSAATLYCEHIGKSQKMPITTLRLFSVYGYYEEPSRLVPTIAKACLTGENPKLADGRPVRDFIFIDDVVDLYLKMVEMRELNGIILNAGTGKQYSVAELVDSCIRVSGAEIVPLWGSLPGRTWDTNCWVADNSKLRNFLHWEPKYDLDTGLKKTLDWFGENLHLYH
jgi:nucleoside-diphosphate-sugar epimerase